MSEKENSTVDYHEQIRQRIGKAEQLREKGVNPYPNDVGARDMTADIVSKFDAMSGEELEGLGEEFRISGRAVALRSFGKAAFMTLRDGSGKLQIYVKRDEVGEEAYKTFKLFEVGDFVWARGTLFRTKTDELTLLAKEVRILTKGIRPLPEKFHGLTDVEVRYRQRYLDLIANEEVLDVFKVRNRAIRYIRDFLDRRDYMEVETPMMHQIPGGAAARPFVTHHNALATDLYLRIAPELYLKRLIVRTTT